MRKTCFESRFSLNFITKVHPRDFIARLVRSVFAIFLPTGQCPILSPAYNLRFMIEMIPALFL
jgi:hypothetical protein